MSNLFSSVDIMHHLENDISIHHQVIDILGKRLKKGYALDYIHSEKEGLTCRIVEQSAYSEDDYYETIPWNEIDQWVEKNTRHQYKVREAFDKIREAYSNHKGY